MYRGLLARIGKSKVNDSSRNSSSDLSTLGPESNSSESKSISSSVKAAPSLGDKSSSFEDGKPVFKGKIVSRPSIDFGKYDPQWIDRAASAPAPQISTDAVPKEVKEKETSTTLAKNLAIKSKDSKENGENSVNNNRPHKAEEAIQSNSIHMSKDECLQKESPSPSNDKFSSSKLANKVNASHGSDPKQSSPSQEAQPLSPSPRALKRPFDNKSDTSFEGPKQPRMDLQVPPPPFYRSYGPHMPPHPEAHFWRRGGPFRGGRGRGMSPPPWRGGPPFPRPFPPFFNNMPPLLHPPSKPFHPPSTVPPFNKVMKQRFTIPPPSVPKKDFKPLEDAAASAFNKKDKSSSELVQDQVTPLWSTPYDKQLKIKEDKVLAFMNKLKTDTLNANRALHSWYSFQENSFPSICKLHPMIPGPLCVGYQSRCNFTIGLDKDNEEIVRIGVLIESESRFVGAIENLKNIPKRIKYAIKNLEDYLKTSSYKPYDPHSKEGNWLTCTVQMTVTDELMMIVSFHPQNLEKLQIKEVRLKLKEYFECGNGSLSELNSLFFNERTLEGGEGNFELIHGADHISERICNQFFRITPRIPFCRSTPGMETVLKALVDVCCLDSETTLVDLCCGGGTVGLSLSQHVGQVLGLDIVEEFVNDARSNSVNNSVTNCEFFTGSGEHYLPVLLNRANFSNIVLVVDPPDIPFDSKVICNIRKCSNISRLVWLLSDPKAEGLKNFEDLVRPPSNQYKGDPFVPVQVIPVDTFPHTFQFTMVIILMRVSMRELVSPREVNLKRFYGPPSSSSKTPSAGASESCSAPFSDYPPPDLSWKKVEEEEAGLTKEQVAWLNQMSSLYKKDFDRVAWVESLRHQNREASGGLTGQHPKPGTAFPYPPPSQQGYTVPPIINASPGSIPRASSGPTPEYWAQYSKQYSSYMMSYNSQNSTAAASSYGGARADPVAWKQYCEQMANYWAQWAASGGSSNQKPAPPVPSTSVKPPPPPPANPPPPLPPSKPYKGPK